uniref:Pyosin/cloacin_T_dom domain-containing protein n=1 Tax=Caenorhabditis tropicalis TaxID=1561998 RepID=A0A1I7US61_9PELO
MSCWSRDEENNEQVVFSVSEQAVTLPEQPQRAEFVAINIPDDMPVIRMEPAPIALPNGATTEIEAGVPVAVVEPGIFMSYVYYILSFSIQRGMFFVI